MHSSLDRAVGVSTLAEDIVFCSRTRHFTLTVALPTGTQVYRLVPTNLMVGDIPAMNQHPFQGGVKLLLVF